MKIRRAKKEEVNKISKIISVLDTKHYKFSKKDKIKTVNITDLTAQIQFRKMVYFDLDDLFDFVVTSEEAGANKPSAKPFELALKKVNIDANDIWIIGDDPISDIAGGTAFNMKTLQIKHDKTPLSQDADFVFYDFNSLHSTYCKLR